MHLREAMLDALQRRRVGAAAIAALDPFGERMHVGLQRFERAARQRLVDGARDVGEVGAQRRDRVLDAARAAQRLDLRRDVVSCRSRLEKSALGAAGCLRPAGTAAAAARRGASSSARWRAAISAIDLIDAELGRLGSERRRAVARDGLAAAGLGGRASRGELFEPGVELGDRVGEPRAAQRGRCVLARRGACRRPRSRRLPKVEFEPFLDRHAGAPRGLARRLVQLGAQPAFIPRSA